MLGDGFDGAAGVVDGFVAATAVEGEGRKVESERQTVVAEKLRATRCRSIYAGPAVHVH
jgi:hypothetical protein